MRVEAAIFASPCPVPREKLARLVGDGCRLDALLEDINEELRGRPYEIILFAGGFQFRTRPRHAESLCALKETKDAGPPDFTKLESADAAGHRPSAADHKGRALAPCRTRRQPRRPRPVVNAQAPSRPARAPQNPARRSPG